MVVDARYPLLGLVRFRGFANKANCNPRPRWHLLFWHLIIVDCLTLFVFISLMEIVRLACIERCFDSMVEAYDDGDYAKIVEQGAELPDR